MQLHITFRSAAEAAFRGVPCHPSPEQALQAGLDLAFEEANQLDVAQNACIIGSELSADG